MKLPQSISAFFLMIVVGAASAFAVDPVIVLDLPGSGTDPDAIDYAGLPTLPGERGIVRPYGDELQFQLHNYLAFWKGRFWCAWSNGPVVEDVPGQEVWYATSDDGLTWNEPATLTGPPEEGHAYIARGLWEREGELLALAAYFKGKGAFGVDKELVLQAWAWDEASGAWQFREKLFDNAINNFAPQRLPNSGDWILTRRDSRFNVSVLVGGVRSLTDWQSFPVVGVRDVEGFRPDEPIFWPSGGDTLFALYRDNSGSQRLFHSLSQDGGKTWGRPVMTNFPNATSKLYSLKTSRGYRVLVSNANPKLARRELHLSVSRDGEVFTRMARLDIPAPEQTPNLGKLWPKFRKGVASLQYPHMIEHDEHLYIAFSRYKWQTEVFRVSLKEIDELLR
ncbi:MAG: exo-alpha-sialidase [Verrucomicrobiae bacterium]|nr:exo-alpha-sialidase [Verrucomicrobiae bacterium]